MLKDAPPEEIAGAVRIIASGGALLAPAVTRSVIEEFARQRPRTARATRGRRRADPARARRPRPPRPRPLEPRDLHRLVISEATTKTHVAHILQKLALRDRIQAVIYAYETGLVSPGPGTLRGIPLPAQTRAGRR